MGQPKHRSLMLILLAALATLAVVAATVAVADRGSTDEDRYRGSEPPGENLLPAFTLASYRGGRVTSGELRGRVVLLTLLDSQCTDACPIIASVVARTVDRLSATERAQVRALAVSGDPAEDSRASVLRFLRSQRAEGRLDYLIGEERKLRPLWTALHLLPSLDTGRDALHSAPLRIYDRDGVWVATLHAGADLSAANLLHDIRRALRAQGDDTR